MCKHQKSNEHDMDPFMHTRQGKRTNNSSRFFRDYKTPWVDGNALRAIIRFVDTNKSIRQLKHIISKAVKWQENNKSCANLKNIYINKK